MQRGLAAEHCLKLVGRGQFADRTIQGTPTQAEVYSPAGTLLATFTGTSSEVLARLKGDLRRTYTTGWLARLQNPASGVHVSLRSERGQEPAYRAGEKVRFVLEADQDCYVTLFDVGTSDPVVAVALDAMEDFWGTAPVPVPVAQVAPTSKVWMR